MNPLNIINHIKVEKPNLIKLIISNQTLIKNPNIFRVFEIFLVIAVISRLLYEIQPPIVLALTLAYEYFHTLSLILLSPSFVFVLGNAIVIALFVNYYSPSYNVQRPKSSLNDQGKKIVGEEAIMAAISAGPADDQSVARFYRRSTSEITARREKVEGGGSIMRRAKSNMDIHKSSKGYCVGHYPEDHMSNEEFRKTIEEFIAKQQRVLREEENFSAFEG
ncbi:hypothetical protein Cgig2_032539 [Carnegiea gigantea]|uniref:DUF4408 domain-containing protein n=1 Tax=Carnegiea gigantea TaxID=171969 RepID=A0A9Q1QQZ1_9CARY|nr:hypothetical protein Cgig2_032539 [Carnegiea gigantea]